MTRQDIEDKVRELMAAKFSIGVGLVTPQTRLMEDLHVDSFGAVELIFEVEEAFGLSIPDSDIHVIKTVNDIVNYIADWKKASTTGPSKQLNPPSSQSS